MKLFPLEAPLTNILRQSPSVMVYFFFFSPPHFALQLLDYVSTAIFFSDKNVDNNLVAWNRVVLLHGKDGGWMNHFSN